jgi:nitrogen-specific signal transduction histidine kinase
VRDGRAELAVELHQARFQAADILSNIRSGIITIDSGRRLRYANPAASALLGLDLDARIGHPVMDEVQAIAPTLGAALERAAETGERTSRAEGVATIGGRRFPIGVTTTFADGSSAVAGWSTTAIFQDISGPEAARQPEYARQRLEAVAELSASLAHEIKNPLASIRSAVEQLARMPHADDDGRTLAGAHRARERPARPAADRVPRLRPRPRHAYRARGRGLDRPGRRGAGGPAPRPARHVEVVCSTPEVPLVIEGDEDLLHRAVFNLALNAVQAAAARGPGGGGGRAGRARPASARARRVRPRRGGAARHRHRARDPAQVRDILFDPFVTTNPAERARPADRPPCRRGPRGRRARGQLGGRHPLHDPPSAAPPTSGDSA